MSVEGSSHLGPDEAVKRQNAELLQADIADLVLLLVGAYADRILPHLPITPPPDGAGTVYDTIMDWATEALEHTDAPAPRRPAAEAVRVFNFEPLMELGRQDVQVRAGLDSARRSVGAAAKQLARARPNSREWYQAKQVLDQAVSQLCDVSAHLMRLAGTEEDALDGVVGVRSVRPAARQRPDRSKSSRPVRSPDRNRARSAGHGRTSPRADAARRSSRSSRTR